MGQKLEDVIPVVKYHGVNTDKDIVTTGTITASNITTTTDNVTLTGTLTADIIHGTGLATFGSMAYPKLIGGVTDYDAQAATLTVAAIALGTVEQNSKTGASTLTTPTGAQLGTAFGNVDGTTLDVVYLNYGNQTSTITAGDGAVSVKGTAAITTTKTAFLRFVNVGVNTWNCYVIAAA